MSASTALAPSIAALEERVARADLVRFLAACYYEPGPEFAEEGLFESMAATAARVDPGLGREAARLGEAFAAAELGTLLVDYTRLFLGGSEIIAKPYESVWRSGSGAGDQTAALLDLYAQGGFEVDQDFRDLPDHIAVELEFLYLLIYQDAARPLRERFLHEHLAAWVPAFTDAAQGGAQTTFYRQLAGFTSQVLAKEASRAAPDEAAAVAP